MIATSNLVSMLNSTESVMRMLTFVRIANTRQLKAWIPSLFYTEDVAVVIYH
jgi:hypothetical protein